jgi:alkylation response protein AidB-like acyl-CoA dehydrogenase
MANAGSAQHHQGAERVAGGYRVTGQWSFGSGVTHAEVVELACVLHENGAPVTKRQDTDHVSSILGNGRQTCMIE